MRRSAPARTPDHLAHDKALHDPELQVPALGDRGKMVEVLDHPAAEWIAAMAFHRPVVLAHRGRVIELDLLSGCDWSQRMSTRSFTIPAFGSQEWLVYRPGGIVSRYSSGPIWSA